MFLLKVILRFRLLLYDMHRALRKYKRNKAKMNKRDNFDPPMAENRF